MEFKFRAIDDRTPTYVSSPSPSLSYFYGQALRVNNTRDPNFMHNPRDFYAIQREIEKERIRHEIVMAELENMHRRLLEEEERRELARRSKMSISIDERLSMQLPTRHSFENHWLEDRFAFPQNLGMGCGHDALPPTLPHFSDAAKDEIRSALEVNKKDKLIMLAKPDPNLCGAKQKATTPPAGSGELPLMSSKKPKEWSCALCQVSATSERGLNEHLQGNKHKAKGAQLLGAQRMCNNSTSSLSKKSGNQIKLTASRDSAGREIKTKLEEESVEANNTVVGLDQEMEGTEDSQNKNEELPKKMVLSVKIQKKKNGILAAEKMKKKLPNRKKFKFWCEDCRVGTHSAIVMEGHKMGKKHLARHNESKPNELKTKEAGLLEAYRKCNNSTSSLSKKSGKQIKLTESRDSAGREIKTKLNEESVEANKTVVGLVHEMEGAEDSQNKNEELPKKMVLNVKTQKKKNGILTAEKMKKKLPNRKKFKFWCEDCQVGTHSAIIMEGHKMGKKHLARHDESKPNEHKAKEAGLLGAHRMCNNSTSSLSKKSGKQIKLTESRDSAGREIKTKLEEESVEANKTVVGLVQEMEGTEDSWNKNGELPKKRDLNVKTQKKIHGILTGEKMKKKIPNRNKFKFWCEDCQVGIHSAIVMEGHKMGKKHLVRHNESKPNEAVPATTSVTIMAPSERTKKTEEEETTEIVSEKPEDKEAVAKEASEESTENITEKAEDEDVVAKEANEETSENVTGDSDSTGSSIAADVAGGW